MAIHSYFFNARKVGETYDRTYTADDFCNYLDKIISNGVFPFPRTSLAVTSTSSMQVAVGAGAAWINGHKMVSDSTLLLDIEPSDVVLKRVDRIVVYLDNDAREMGIKIKKGTADFSPQPPMMEENELCLAEITVDKQATQIAQMNINDTRADSLVCGWVTGLVEQLDTSSILAQIKTEFDDWFNQAKEDFKSNLTAVRKYSHVYTTTAADQSQFNVKSFLSNYAPTTDILEVRINGLTLNGNEYAVNNSGVVTLNTAIAAAGTEIEFVIYKGE